MPSGDHWATKTLEKMWKSLLRNLYKNGFKLLNLLLLCLLIINETLLFWNDLFLYQISELCTFLYKLLILEQNSIYEFLSRVDHMPDSRRSLAVAMEGGGNKKQFTVASQLVILYRRVLGVRFEYIRTNRSIIDSFHILSLQSKTFIISWNKYLK